MRHRTLFSVPAAAVLLVAAALGSSCRTQPVHESGADLAGLDIGAVRDEVNRVPG
jgi:hypothetical protein